ncbi:hypothetical protein M426DRAFT_26952 [Hypoxylon sp. CI-4A]|nr:hypothetical protein M426DRAFT_26952 [Hypoxylon sp. CI-4A]
MCLKTVYYTQDAQNLAVLEPFTAIQPQINQPGVPKTLNLTQMASGQAAGVSNQTRCAYMNVTVKADVATLQAATTPLQSCDGLTSSLALQPYPVSLLEQSVAKGGNSLGLNPLDGPVVLILLLNYWNEKSGDERILTIMKGALEKIHAKAKEDGSRKYDPDGLFQTGVPGGFKLFT